jgi:transposase
MNSKETNRLEVMQKLAERRMSQKKVAKELGISPRQVKRLWKRYREIGAEGLVSIRRGKPSNNRLSADVEQAVVDLLHSRYADFGPTLAHEKLVELDGLHLSVGSVRKIMIGEELWKAKKVQKVQAYQMRERRSCFGELVQIDGSLYDWFEGRAPACTLLVFIDDATGKLVQLLFVESESFFSYCRAAQGYIIRYGKPGAFYSDKHGIFPGQSVCGRPYGRPDPVRTGHAGIAHPDHLCQHPAG